MRILVLLTLTLTLSLSGCVATIFTPKGPRSYVIPIPAHNGHGFAHPEDL